MGFEYPLVLAGPKSNEYGEAVVAQIASLGREANVIYIGEVDYQDLPSLYKSARGLIFASSCECCPNILLEKLAAGKPVLCSNTQPMPEFAGEAVLYFSTYEPDSLRYRINELENDVKLRESLGQAAYKQALNYDWNITVKETLNFLLDTQLFNEKDANNLVT